MDNSGTAPEASRAAELRACKKAAWRLLPLLALGYFINYLDRTNVGFAALKMNGDLGLTASQSASLPGFSISAIACSKCPATWPCTAMERASGWRAS